MNNKFDRHVLLLFVGISYYIVWLSISIIAIHVMFVIGYAKPFNFDRGGESFYCRKLLEKFTLFLLGIF